MTANLFVPVGFHPADAGIASGGPLHHYRPEGQTRDPLATYPLVQQAAALLALLHLLRDAGSGHLVAQPHNLGRPSREWYHPTLLQYVAGRIRGILL